MNNQISSTYKPRSIINLKKNYFETLDTSFFRLKKDYRSLNITNFQRIFSLILFLKSFSLQIIKRIIMYEMIPLHLRKPKRKRDCLNLLITILKNSFRLKALSHFLSKKPSSKLNIGKDFKELKSTGCIVKHLSHQNLFDISNSLDTHFDRLRERRNQSYSINRQFEESRLYLDAVSNHEIFKLFNEIFTKSGIFEIASDYLNRNVKLIDINPQINDSTDNFWRKSKSETKDNIPRTSYIHRDASGGDIKIIIYLTNVNELNGPFCYISGSHIFKQNFIPEIVAETNDANGFSAMDIDSRKRFASLPSFFQRKCTVGNDIENSDDISESILSSEWKITSQKGSMIIFDTKGLHRGGLLEEGERKVVTCVLG